MKIGDPMDPDTHVGALISKEHMEKVLSYIEAGKRPGPRSSSVGAGLRTPICRRVTSSSRPCLTAVPTT